MKYALAIACAGLLISSAANAQLTGTQVNGTLTFNGGGLNAFDPANGYVPAGYGNSTSANGVTIGSGTEFGFNDGANLDIANFTDTQLIIGDLPSGNYIDNPLEMTFTTLTPGAFAELSLVSSNFTGLTYNLVGDTITIDWTGGTVAGNQQMQAVFNITGGVPEPATWAMMLLGFAGMGFVMRRSERTRSIQIA